MTDTAHRTGEAARSVFEGLTANAPEEEAPRRLRDSRAARSVFSTVPIVLVGSMAAFGLTAPIDAAQAKAPLKPRGATSELGKSIRDAVAAASTAIANTTASIRQANVAAPTTYRVVAGDTVSDIAGRYGLSTASVLALNGLGWSSLIFPGQELKLTASGPLPVEVAAEPVSSGRYTIVTGDTISAIADRFGVSTLSVLTANGLGWSSIIYPGQTIAIPGSVGPGDVNPERVAAAPADEVVVEDEAEVLTDAVPVVSTEPAPAPEPPAAPAPVVSTYTVVSGDTLSGIAARYGITTQALLDSNGLSWESVIYPGTVLTISGVAAPVSYGGNITMLNDEMRANAAIIVQVGRELGVSDYGIVIALATAMQESSLRNLDWGDRDSVGLFQQRPSSGWGTVEQLTDPYHASRLFYGGPSNPNRGYTRGLLDISGWESLPLTVAAQRVQISAYPDAYAKWEASAYAWFAELR